MVTITYIKKNKSGSYEKDELFGLRDQRAKVAPRSHKTTARPRSHRSFYVLNFVCFGKTTLEK